MRTAIQKWYNMVILVSTDQEITKREPQKWSNMAYELIHLSDSDD